MGSLTLPQVARGWAKDPARHLVGRLSKHRVLGPLVQGPPATKPVGLMKLKTFFHRAAGPGWALVGDAGLHKDPTPGLGITDALRAARSLAEAILEGTDPAFERYWRLRDVQSVPLFRMAEDMGSLEYDNAMTRLVFRHVNRSPALKERMRRVTMRELQPQELVSPGRVLGWMALELLRGRFDVVAGFLRSGKRAAALEKEMRAVQDALARLEAVAGAAASAPV
jgi:flavin-dependent dehydrogenase